MGEPTRATVEDRVWNNPLAPVKTLLKIPILCILTLPVAFGIKLYDEGRCADAMRAAEAARSPRPR